MKYIKTLNKKIFPGLILVLLFSFSFLSYAYASEVSGTLSSSGGSSQNKPQPKPDDVDDNDGSGGGKLSGSVSSSGGSSAGNESNGLVLGASTSNSSPTATPSASGASTVSPQSGEAFESGSGGLAQLTPIAEDSDYYSPSLSSLAPALEEDGTGDSMWLPLILLTLFVAGLVIYLLGRPANDIERV